MFLLPVNRIVAYTASLSGITSDMTLKSLYISINFGATDLAPSVLQTLVSVIETTSPASIDLLKQSAPIVSTAITGTSFQPKFSNAFDFLKSSQNYPLII